MNREEYIERDVINPSGVVQVVKNYYWWCVDADPTRALFFQGVYKRDIGYPQCNANKETAEKVGELLGYNSFAKLIQIPVAFEPWSH